MVVLIRQARIADLQSELNDKVVDILLEDGIIRNIADHLDAKADTVIEGNSLYVSPGWIDLLADYREPGYEQKETIKTGLEVAAAGGFTDVMLVPNTDPSLSTKSIIQYVKQKSAGNIVSLHPLGTITQGANGVALAEMLDMHAHGAVAFTDGWKPIQDAGVMMKALEYAKAFDGTLIQIPTDATLVAGGLMNEGNVSTSLGMAGIPALAETLMVHRDIELAKYTGSKLHLSGISTAESVDMIRKAKAAKVNVTCSVTPYHLTLTDAALAGYDSVYKVSPPLRADSDRQALIEGILDGTIDCIASHHRPQEWDAKAKEFEYASEGMNLQDITFSLVWSALENKMTPGQIVRLFTSAPAAIFGLPERKIAINNKINLTIFTPGARWIVTSKSLSQNNPYLGKEIACKVIGIINGQKIHLNKD